MQTPTIYTISYHHHHADAYLSLLVRKGYHIVDIRPWSHTPLRALYTALLMKRHFGRSYHQIKELGNVSAQERGIRKFLSVIQDETTTSVVFLCSCTSW